MNTKQILISLLFSAATWNMTVTMEPKSPDIFEDVIECLTNPHSNCSDILISPEDTGIYSKTYFNLRSQALKTIAKTCGSNAEVANAIKTYKNILTNKKLFSGQSLYDQNFRENIKQKEHLTQVCLIALLPDKYWRRQQEWNDKDLEERYKNSYVTLLEHRMLQPFAYTPHLSQDYKPFLADLMSVIEKKETSEIFESFKRYHTRTKKDPHNIFDITECMINPTENCNTILFSLNGDFTQSEFNIRCKAKKTIADYINNPDNLDNIRNGEKRCIKNSSAYYKGSNVAHHFQKMLIIHTLFQDISSSYDCSCDDTDQENFYNKLNKFGFKRIVKNTIFKKPKQDNDKASV